MINIYCDESCHLENDDSNIMVLGAIQCPSELKDSISYDIREIKKRYYINTKAEAKWTKVSNSKLDLYKELVEYFFKNDNLKFRAVVVNNKKKLNHKKYNYGDPDLWYYKMYFLLLDKICDIDNSYRIFIDVKDTNGGPRIKKLKEVLCNNRYDYKGDIIKDVSQVNSNRVDLLQLTDIFIGALAFYHRELYKNPNNSQAKSEIIDKIIDNVQEKSIKSGTVRDEKKFNVFIWSPDYRRR